MDLAIHLLIVEEQAIVAPTASLRTVVMLSQLTTPSELVYVVPRPMGYVTARSSLTIRRGGG